MVDKETLGQYTKIVVETDEENPVTIAVTGFRSGGDTRIIIAAHSRVLFSYSHLFPNCGS